MKKIIRVLIACFALLLALSFIVTSLSVTLNADLTKEYEYTIKFLWILFWFPIITLMIKKRRYPKKVFWTILTLAGIVLVGCFYLTSLTYIVGGLTVFVWVIGLGGMICFWK